MSYIVNEYYRDKGTKTLEYTTHRPPRPARNRRPHKLITAFLHIIIICTNTAPNIQKPPAHTRQGHQCATHPNIPIPLSP